MRQLLILAAVALATATFTVDAQQRYRWVDDNGSIRISDRIPPSATDKRIEVLNSRGMVVRVIEPKRELTPEEEAARELERAAAEQAKVAQAAQARRDRMLLDTYTSVDDLVRSRDTRVSSLAAQIVVSRDALEAHRSHLEELEGNAAGLVKSGRAVPPALAKKIEETRELFESTRKFVEMREKEQADIRAQFEADIARFQALRGSGLRED
ncbi:MAG: hypothetical protein WD081_01215 [Gammaproteobacteria bacterium]